MRIGEVARRSGVSARMLRHYDELGIVTPGDRSPARLLHDLDRRTRERITREQALPARLAQIDDAGPNDWEQVLSMLALLSGLSSPSADRRQHAALTVDREGRSPGVLVAALREEADPNVAGALRWALAQTGAAAPERCRIAQALGEIPGAPAAQTLTALCSDADDAVRHTATYLLTLREPE